MLALTGLLTILALQAAIISRRLSPLAGLIVIPAIAAVLAGFGLRTGSFMVTGIQSVAPVAGMFIFAILYFGVVTDAGMLDPLIDKILRVMGASPPRIVVGTALLALLVHLDGSGAVTFLVTVPVMLPVYRRLGMDPRILACAASLAAGVNFLPWTGPVIRASSALHVPISTLFRPVLPVQIVGLCLVFGICYWLGWKEQKRLGVALEGAISARRELTDAERMLRRPRFVAVNLALTVVLMTVMISGKLEPVVVFMIGLVCALLINYPDPKVQAQRVDAHARAALMMAGVLFAAGAFTGIMKETGMLSAMAKAAVSQVPAGAAHHVPFVLAVVSMPLSMLFDPDSFYFGALPVMAEGGRLLGVPAVQFGQAALMGQMTTGFPVSPLTPATFLLVGLCGIDLAQHQKYSIPFLFVASLVMTAAAIVLGVFPL